MRPLLFSLALLTALSPARAQDRIRVGGPAPIMERLAGLREKVEHWHPDLRIEWVSNSSGAGFTSLFDGSVDLLLTSRSIVERERKLASRLGIDLHERVLALDAVAVVVHPGNGVQSLSLEQLETLFKGKIVGWYGFGGSDRTIRLVSPLPASGEFQVLEERVLGPDSMLAPEAEFVGPEEAVLATVSSDPRAVGLVPMSVDRSKVRTVPLVAAAGGQAILPTYESVYEARYPLNDSLWLYHRGTPDEAIRRILYCVLSTEGQAEIAKAGLTALPADRAFQRQLASRSRANGAAVTRVSFGFRGSNLNGEAGAALAALATRAIERRAAVWITGHSDVREEPPSASSLAEARARTVESFLKTRGVVVAGIEAVGSKEPVASAFDPDGGGHQRADVWWLARN